MPKLSQSVVTKGASLCLNSRQLNIIKKSLKNVRAVLNRHLKDIGCDIDIVKDTEFKAANAMLNAKLKFNLINGLSRPTRHHPIIPAADIIKMNKYLNIDNPVALRFKIWYLLAS